MAFWQRHFKRLLAFSTISHVGMLLAGIGTLNARGVGGAGLYVIGHGMVKSALFLCAGLFLQRFGSIDELKLRGQGRETKFVGLIVLVAALGLAGFPPFGTYLGKNLMEESAQRFGQEWLSWVFALASVITGAAALRVGGRVFLGWGGEPKGEAASPTKSETRETKGGGPLPPVMVTTAAVLALLPAFSSFVPGFSHAMQAAAERLVDTRSYAAAVLDSKWSGAIHASEATEVTTRGLIIGFATAGAALALAGFSLSQKRLPAIAPLETIRTGLRHLHSGDARDYVAWLSLGLATIGGALLVLLG
jgi:multicomponent Na+:H+ antiporter subunit D